MFIKIYELFKNAYFKAFQGLFMFKLFFKGLL